MKRAAGFSLCAGALVVALAAGGLPACESRGGDSPTARHGLSADALAAPAAPPAHDDKGVNMSTSTHRSALERVDASIDVLARAADRVPARVPARADAPLTTTSSDASAGDPALVGEERERDPRSDTVKIKVIVDQRRQAHVIWGRKDFGPAPLEIQRPRNSGPLDLVVVAPGYLPHHARAFTDRDDSVSLHLYSLAEAPQLLGYRSPAAVPSNTQGNMKDGTNSTKDTSGGTVKSSRSDTR